jgi:predicted nucleotidyltransferase/uncharacterized protein with HEPN domain
MGRGMATPGIRAPDVSMAEEVLIGLNTIFPVIKNMYGVKKIGMFGAFARRDAIPVDAVELMVEFSPGFETYRHYLGLKWHLEEYFSTRINLITTRVLAESPAAASFDPEMGEVDQEALMQVLGELDFLQARCKGMAYESFARESLLRRACERSLQIMSLAVRRISASQKDMFPGAPWKEVEGISQSIAEARFGADPFLLWHFIVTEVPGFTQVVRSAIQAASRRYHHEVGPSPPGTGSSED